MTVHHEDTKIAKTHEENLSYQKFFVSFVPFVSS